MSTTTSSETAATGAGRAQSPWRVVGASLVGTTLEWYDFFLYGTAAAVVFPKVFFVESDPLTGTLLSFLTYALGFAARPLGGIFFGNLGDRLGRKRALVITLVVMGAATTLIAAVPSYASIGAAAPILLTTLRMVQGFALGGARGRAAAGRRGAPVLLEAAADLVRRADGGEHLVLRDHRVHPGVRRGLPQAAQVLRSRRGADRLGGGVRADPGVRRPVRRVGRRPVYLAGAIGIGVWTPFFFGMLNSRSYPQAVAAVTIALAFHGLMYAPQAAFFAELFTTRVRYSGASIGYQVASIAASALAAASDAGPEPTA